MEIKNLMQAITIHNGLLNELLQVLERETTEMATLDIAAMSLSNQAINELVAKIAEHAQHLQQTASLLAAHEGLPGTASLGAIAEHVAKRGNRDLLASQRKIYELAEQIRQVIAFNSGIATRFASTVTSSLSFISSLINQSNVYGASGGYQLRPTGAIMINRVA